MKFHHKKYLPERIFWGILFLLLSISSAQAASPPSKSIETDIVIRAMTEKEKKRDDRAAQQSIKPHQSDAEKIVEGANSTLGTIAGAGKGVTDNIIKGAKKFSKTRISKSLQQVNRIDAKTAQKIVKNGKGNLKMGGELLAVADDIGTAGSVAGSLVGGD